MTNWEMGDMEVGYTLIPPYTSSGGSQLLNIPKLMPDIPQGKPKVTPAGLNKSCYINADECKPTVPSQISTQNYITVPPQDNREFALPVFYAGTPIRLEVRNRNPDTIFLSTKEDNSTVPPP